MIPAKKIELAKQKVRGNCDTCRDKVNCYNCWMWDKYIDQMVKAEIPVDYWFKTERDFIIENDLIEFTKNSLNSIDELYSSGKSYYFAGERGRGKTMAACLILKKALQKNYSAFYITLSDLVDRIIRNDKELKLNIKNFDFLVIDEIDNRFFPTENSMELYGGQLENVIRGRMQNTLPTIMCSNAVDIGLIFKKEFKKSFSSLWAQFVESVIAVGRDARREEIDE